MPGPLPKDPDARARRNKPEVPTDTVESDGELRGFELPDHPNVKWCEHTRQWWDMWRKSPQSKLMIDSDWWSLLSTAIIHNEIWRTRYAPFTGGNKPLTANALGMLLAELRQREKSFGATWEDRKRGRLDVGKEPDGTEPDFDKIVNEGVNYTEKFLKAVAEKNK